MLEHIGHVVMMSVPGYRDRWFEPWLHQYVVSLSKTLYLHCFSRLSCEMSNKKEHLCEGCLFSSIGFSEEIVYKNQRNFFFFIWLHSFTMLYFKSFVLALLIMLN